MVTGFDLSSATPRSVMLALTDYADERQDLLPDILAMAPHRERFFWLDGFAHALALLAAVPELMPVWLRAAAAATPHTDLAAVGVDVLSILLPMVAAREQREGAR